MLRFVADENFYFRIVQGLRRRLPSLDIVRVQEMGIAGISDPDLLAWAAEAHRLLVTHDARTMAGFAYKRMGLACP